MKTRDTYHTIIGFEIAYIIGSITNFETYTLDGRLIGVPILSLFIGVIFGLAWELLQLYKGLIDGISLFDVALTMVGTFIGGMACLIVPDNIWIGGTFGLISLILLLGDVKYFIKKK